jgi:hypothetical protein
LPSSTVRYYLLLFRISLLAYYLKSNNMVHCTVHGMFQAVGGVKGVGRGLGSFGAYLIGRGDFGDGEEEVK